METINIKLTGNIPPKKNARQLVYVRGRPLFLPSKRHKEWEQDALTQLKAQETPVLGLSEGVSITYNLKAKDRRKKDASNTIESINDLLVKYGILEDDNWFVIEKMTINIVEIDKVGGAEIAIEYGNVV